MARDTMLNGVFKTGLIHMLTIKPKSNVKIGARACINADSTPDDYKIIIYCIADLLHTVIVRAE